MKTFTKTCLLALAMTSGAAAVHAADTVNVGGQAMYAARTSSTTP